MPLDPAQCHQIEQDPITAAWAAERRIARDDAIALLREIADLEREDDTDVILGVDSNGRNDLLSRITIFLAHKDQQEEPTRPNSPKPRPLSPAPGPGAPKISPCRCQRLKRVRRRKRS